jgi:hypothetical protein
MADRVEKTAPLNTWRIFFDRRVENKAAPVRAASKQRRRCVIALCYWPAPAVSGFREIEQVREIALAFKRQNRRDFVTLAHRSFYSKLARQEIDQIQAAASFAQEVRWQFSGP